MVAKTKPAAVRPARRAVYLKYKRRGWSSSIEAYGELDAYGGITVHAMSMFAPDELDCCPPWSRDLRHDLRTEGKLTGSSTLWWLTEDRRFDTLSSAACAITGSSVSGHLMWRYTSTRRPVGSS